MLPSDVNDTKVLFMLAQASREAAKAQLTYVEMKLHESQLSLMYYQHQVEDSQKRLREANECVGRVRAEMRENYIAIYTRDSHFQSYPDVSTAMDNLDVHVFFLQSS